MIPTRSLALTLTLLLTLASPGFAEEGRLTVELNKFETSETGTCQAYFLFRNEMEATVQGFEMSIAVLDTDGVIDRLLSVDAAPLPVARTTLKLFEIPEIGCDAISELLVHDIPNCALANSDVSDCFGLVTWKSLTATRLGP